MGNVVKEIHAVFFAMGKQWAGKSKSSDEKDEGSVEQNPMLMEKNCTNPSVV